MVDCKKKFKLGTVNLGLKMFDKNKGGKSRGAFRLMQEGMGIMLPYMDDTRQVHVKPDFIKAIAEEPERAFTFKQIEEKFSAKL